MMIGRTAVRLVPVLIALFAVAKFPEKEGAVDLSEVVLTDEHLTVDLNLAAANLTQHYHKVSNVYHSPNGPYHKVSNTLHTPNGPYHKVSNVYHSPNGPVHKIQKAFITHFTFRSGPLVLPQPKVRLADNEPAPSES